MTRNPSNIPGHTSRHCDGTPGLEYFQEGYAFTWTGRATNLIEVSSGGYGEPVDWLIDFNANLAAPGATLLDEFREVCDQWLFARERRTEPSTPHEPRWSDQHKATVCSVCLVPRDEIPAAMLAEYGTELPAQWEDCQQRGSGG